MSSVVPAKPAPGCVRPSREEALGDAALVEDLDRARVEAAGPRARPAPASGRRSTTTTSTPARASSPASIRPVGPAPTMVTSWVLPSSAAGLGEPGIAYPSSRSRGSGAASRSPMATGSSPCTMSRKSVTPTLT